MAGEYIDRVAQSRTELVTYLDQSSAGISAAIDEATDNVAGRLNAAGAQFLVQPRPDGGRTPRPNWAP